MRFCLHLERYSLRVYRRDKDRHCKSNVSLWRVRVTIVAVETQQYVLCLFHIFSSTGRFSKKKIIEHKMRVLIFSTPFA
jgi:hypothetical protein